MDEQLCDALYQHVRQAILDGVPGGRIGVAFSGGVDSALVARMCSDLGYDTVLMTVGFAGSHDIDFAGRVAHLYGCTHKILEIDGDSFEGVAAMIRRQMQGCSLSWIENAIAFHYIVMLAKSHDIGVVVTANGIDELFCGYDAYRGAFGGGDGAIKDMIDRKVRNEQEMLDAICRIVGIGDIMVQPLLSDAFVRFASTIPIHEKIRGPDDMIRKHAIRALAARCGVPKVSYEKRKKAMQYGSDIHRMLMKISKARARPC